MPHSETRDAAVTRLPCSGRPRRNQLVGQWFTANKRRVGDRWAWPRKAGAKAVRRKRQGRWWKGHGPGWMECRGRGVGEASWGWGGGKQG